jgi:hypothetical protein
MSEQRRRRIGRPQVLSVRLSEVESRLIRRGIDFYDGTLSDFVRDAALRFSEQIRRDAAHRTRHEVIEGSGVAGVPKALPSAPRGFYEDDEPAAEVVAAFERGEKGVTRPPLGWTCPHMTITSGGVISTPPSAGCGCVMTPICSTEAA